MNIALIQTPYHLMIFQRILKLKKFRHSTWTIYCSSLIIEEARQKITSKEILEYSNLDLSLKREILFNLNHYKKIRSGIKDFRLNFKNIQYSNSISNFITFSEKSLISQLILKDLNTSTKVWCIDEGVGPYRKRQRRDFLIKLLYKGFTPFLIGFQYDFFRVLGTHNRIDALVLRIPSKNKKVISFQEFGLNQTPSRDPYSGERSNNILVLTGPYSEDSKILKKEEISIYSKVIKLLTKKGFNIIIKPHPRELIEKYSTFRAYSNLAFIEYNKSSEELDYFQFDYIVNFYSSAVIDIISHGYDGDRIISIDLVEKIDLKGVFDRTHQINRKNLDKIRDILR
ncbi:polysialyltransferase family glycosyltransferase [Salinimicrobium catena]|uniref:polysialyltransferase family glycosyltransferase n=1 Tax=Salinimicrobium catena TaxID=390640 RepID=UPI002FE4CC3C